MVARIAEREEPEVGKLLRGLKAIRVNVMGLSEGESSAVQKRVQKITGALDEKGWDRIVSVREKNDRIAVFVKTRGDEAVEGLFVSILEGNSEAVLVNIVGDIRPEQLAMVGERLNIEPLKKVAKALN